jgi:hypothetical protein
VSAATVDHTWLKPLPKQLDLIHSTAKETCYAGGFGSGKTLCGAEKCLRESMLHPGTVGLVGRQTYRALEDTTKKAMVTGDDKPPIIPRELWAGPFNEGDNKLTLVNGSEIIFRSLEPHNVEKLMSLNLGWVYVDELTETTERVWLALGGRLRHPAGPRIAWGTTNPNGHDWVWRRFHPDSTSREDSAVMIHAPTEENVHLTPDYLAWLRAQPSEWVKRYVDASFDTAAGMIWDEWNRHIHVVPDSVDLPYDWRRFESLDHGRRNPTAYLQWIVAPDGELLVDDEYYATGLVSAHAFRIKALRARHNDYGAIVADPAVFTADASGQTVAGEYQKHAIGMVRADNAVDAGLLRVSELLKRRPDVAFPDWHPFGGTLGPDGLGAPMLFVKKRCENLRREIPNYVWKDLSPSMEEKVDQPEEPRKKDDHACDALRYGAMSRPRPTSVAPPRTEDDKRSRAQSAGISDTRF